MSQDRTEMGFGGFGNRQEGPYSRGSNGTEGTVIPGMEGCAPGVKSGSKNNATKEPVVGFLYSISRQGIGEYWTLHLGKNTIGRSDKCDVSLKERTVSELHAALNIKQMKSDRKSTRLHSSHTS